MYCRPGPSVLRVHSKLSRFAITVVIHASGWFWCYVVHAKVAKERRPCNGDKNQESMFEIKEVASQTERAGIRQSSGGCRDASTACRKLAEEASHGVNAAGRCIATALTMHVPLSGGGSWCRRSPIS